MITPTEIERLRDLNSPQADALIDSCRPRCLVVAKAQYGEYENAAPAAPVLSYKFSDGQGSSGLSRGDVIRGHVFGIYRSDTSGLDTDVVLYVLVNSNPVAQVMITRGDLAGDVIAFESRFTLRLSGEQKTSLNNPPGSNAVDVRCTLTAAFGDTSTSPVSRSQAVADSWITSSDVTPQQTNLAAPITVALAYEGQFGCRLTIYGGAMEGL